MEAGLVSRTRIPEAKPAVTMAYCPQLACRIMTAVLSGSSEASTQLTLKRYFLSSSDGLSHWILTFQTQSTMACACEIYSGAAEVMSCNAPLSSHQCARGPGWLRCQSPQGGST